MLRGVQEQSFDAVLWMENLEAMDSQRKVETPGEAGSVAAEGWVAEEALAIGLFCALTADVSSPAGVARALWCAAAHGGDSDSTSAIAGQLLGARLGLAGLPPRWLRQVELGAELETLGRQLWASRLSEASSG